MFVLFVFSFLFFLAMLVSPSKRRQLTPKLWKSELYSVLDWCEQLLMRVIPHRMAPIHTNPIVSLVWCEVNSVCLRDYLENKR